MLPSSLAVLVAALGLGTIALVLFAWAWRRGQFEDPGRAARVILDERDLRMRRPWESPDQRLERAIEHGAPVDPPPGSWGGAE